MGQHTWFVKSKAAYLEQKTIEKENKTDYHDLFRTNKRNLDGTYTSDTLSSLAETLEWIENNEVSFKSTVFDTDEQELKYREEAIIKLQEFWKKYPEGLIYFG